MTKPALTPSTEPQEVAGEGAAFADVLDVHTAPEPTRTGRTNLCGGTMQTLDPLAHDGWSDKPCPGCDGCREAEPPAVDVLTEEEFVRAFEARMQQVGEQEECDDLRILHAPPATVEEFLRNVAEKAAGTWPYADEVTP